MDNFAGSGALTETKIRELYKHCTLCPRKCGADRYERFGFCKAGTQMRLAKAMLHYWEEPVLCAEGGSGAVFFSNCTLRCVFCQNYSISAEGFGKEVSVPDLADIFLRLKQQGAQNIDLITATHYLPSVTAALDLVKHRLDIPVVYNCGGYESAETIRMLDEYIDIYLPDIKYFNNKFSVKFSSAPDYFETACAALEEMIRQTGKPVIVNGSLRKNADDLKTLPDTGTVLPDSDSADCKNSGIVRTMKRGVIVRHMILPGCRKDSIAVLGALSERFGTDKFLISLLRQYTPFYKAKTEPEYKSINRRVTGYEYDSVVREAARLGFDGFMQEKSSAKEEYTPLFDLSGL